MFERELDSGGNRNAEQEFFTMQLYLIRHAESENNARAAYLRVEDPGITAVGRLQCQHLALWIKSLSIDHLITSPFLRTLQTTRYVTDVNRADVQVWHDVFERGGCFRGHGPDATEGGIGLGRADVIRHVVDDANRCTVDSTIKETGWWGGQRRETDDEACARAGKVVKRLSATFGSSGQAVVAIIHADFKRALLAQMLNASVDPRIFGALRNTGISKLDFDGDRWTLDWFNSVTHLPHKLITGNET
ncbi:histidine phosphatase family protein [Rubripirellula reticaptiva]|uniref:Phosphoglycerate mutase n=1 Tax=Rubripirellula reticaptiva TaxID=2528013 RepID=A0A5C6EKW0_9BACT|nr:histidine phosphatase family protein [Rubripirellula reticaptiva]TWU48211.1 phosphoglycerate mutase [Rubripirellula reticaptiva]